ncbi:MAG: ribosomal protein L7/L12 [bacterium]|nr:ribosomal protein L7/L12 [bacterium]
MNGFARLVVCAALGLTACEVEVATSDSTVQTKSTTQAVVLTQPGRRLLEVIKLLREVTGKGLKDAKDAVDSPPSVVGEGLTPAEAKALAQRFTDIGAKVELRTE